MKVSSEFGKKIAKIMLDLSSIHVFFIIQQAYGDKMSWDDVEELLKLVLADKEK